MNYLLQNNAAEKKYNRIKLHVQELGIRVTEMGDLDLILIANQRDSFARFAKFCNEYSCVVENEIRREYWQMQSCIRLLRKMHTKYGLTTWSNSKLQKHNAKNTLSKTEKR